MRKVNQQITDPSLIEEIFSQGQVCHIAMMDNSRPYLLPFNYGYKENCVYIHSANEGKKLNLLKANNYVCFEIEQKAEIIKNEIACKWATSYRSVVGYGHIETVTDFHQKKYALEIIMKHNGAAESIIFDEKQINSVVILKLTIEELTAKQSSNWNNIKEYTFESERLIFKEITWPDTNDIHKHLSFPEVDEFNTLGIPDSVEATKALMKPWIEQKTKSLRSSFNWKLVLKETNEFMGLAGLSLSNDKFRLGEIYYKLNPEFWNQGYATEAAKRLIRYGFEDFNLHKVEAGVATENIRSIKVLEKAGMTREGLRKKILPIRGKWIDNYHYAIVESDNL